MERIRILFTMLASIVLSVVVFFSYMDVDSVNAQYNNSTDPKQLLRDFQTAKETIKNKIQINFDQLINEIETQLDFNSVDSYLSQASQYFINGKVSKGISELEKANRELKNSSLTIMNAGDEFVSFSKDNSTFMADGTKEILGHFGKILKDLGTKVNNSMIQLNY
ncbi:MAG: hypothetical protein ACRD6U_10040 [Nitrososphaeraceae archaeon]